MTEYLSCFACGAKSLNIEGEIHPYMLSSPGCWAMFTEVMVREYQDIEYARAHHFSVDSYACQHPGDSKSGKAIRSVAIHMASLYMILEEKMSFSEAVNFKSGFAQFNKQKNLIIRLNPPENLGQITVFDVWNLENGSHHFETCHQWAQSVWQAWKDHHETIRIWVKNYQNSIA